MKDKRSFSMRAMFRIIVLVYVAAITVFLAISIALAYEEGNAGEAVVEGIITFKGTPPPPKLFPLRKFPNTKFCSQIDTDEKGNRILREVTVNNGNLQDVVVYIE